MKKAFLDLKNGRGDWKSNISKMLYYGAIQNAMFVGMQQALFAMMFNDEEEPDDDETYGCSPDQFVGNDGLLEIKSPLAKNLIKYWMEIDEIRVFSRNVGLSYCLWTFMKYSVTYMIIENKHKFLQT